MNLGSSEIVSQATVKTATRLSTIGAIILFIFWFDVELEGLELFGVKLSGVFFYSGALFSALIFTCVHLVHWTFDYLAFTAWFERNLSPVQRWNDARDVDRTVGEEIRIFLAEVQGQMKRGPEDQEALQSVRTNLEELIPLLQRCGRSFGVISLLTRFMFFGWYGAMPLLVGAAGAVICACQTGLLTW